MSKTTIGFNYETPQGLKSFEMSLNRLEEWGTHDLSEEEKDAVLALASAEMGRQKIDPASVRGDVKIVESLDGPTQALMGIGVLANPALIVPFVHLNRDQTWKYDVPASRLPAVARLLSPQGTKGFAGSYPAVSPAAPPAPTPSHSPPKLPPPPPPPLHIEGGGVISTPVFGNGDPELSMDLDQMEKT